MEVSPARQVVYLQSNHCQSTGQRTKSAVLLQIFDGQLKTAALRQGTLDYVQLIVIANTLI